LAADVGAGAKRLEDDSFESALERLEEIVRRLEGEELSLDESLELFEEGIGLSRAMDRRLDEAQRRIELLLEGEDGEPSIEPYEPDEGGA